MARTCTNILRVVCFGSICPMLRMWGLWPKNQNLNCLARALTPLDSSHRAINSNVTIRHSDNQIKNGRVMLIIFDLDLPKNLRRNEKKNTFFGFWADFFGALIKNLLRLVFVRSILTSILKVSDKFIKRCRSRLFGYCQLSKMRFWDMKIFVVFTG